MLLVSEVQEFLQKKGFYHAEIDGVYGKQSRAAAENYLKAVKPQLSITSWTDDRIRVAVEQLIYAGAGLPVGEIDGLRGPQTEYAHQAFRAKMRGDGAFFQWRDAKIADNSEPKQTVRPLVTKWPKYEDLTEFFGAPGKNLVTCRVPFTMRLAWDLGKEITSFQCHKLVRAQLEDIFGRMLSVYGLSEIQRLRLDRFGGCYNSRPMRGSKKLSTHAWGIAVDIDPERNQYKWGRKLAQLDDKAYDSFWNIVESTGAVSLGRRFDFDWMHFQFCEQ